MPQISLKESVIFHKANYGLYAVVSYTLKNAWTFTFIVRVTVIVVVVVLFGLWVRTIPFELFPIAKYGSDDARIHKNPVVDWISNAPPPLKSR